MTIEDIKKIIVTDETRTLELKKSTGELKDGMHSACAFLNTDGGWLFFGIAPSTLNVIGQQVTDKTRQEIAQAIKGFEPALDIAVEYIDIPERPGNVVVAMHLEGWTLGKMPFSYHGCPYVRVESTTQIMPREMFVERVRASLPHEYDWENQFALGITIDDLDSSRIEGAVKLGVDSGRITAAALTDSAETVLKKWKLLKDGRPTNAAAALFLKGSGPYTQFGIRMACFLGTDKNEFIDNKRAEGNFFDLLDAGLSFLLKHLSISGKIVGLRRIDQVEIPLEALREGLTNCLCHRAMELYRSTPSIAIFSDRIEISNPGKFIEGITVENIKEPHESHPYNPTVANVLFQTTYLESWGRGVGRIMEACKERGLPEPYYYQSNGFVTLVIKRPVQSKIGEEFGEENQYQELTERQRIIIRNILSNGACTSKSLAKSLSMTERTVQREMSFLRNNGYITKEGSDAKGLWKVLK